VCVYSPLSCASLLEPSVLHSTNAGLSAEVSHGRWELENLTAAGTAGAAALSLAAADTLFEDKKKAAPFLPDILAAQVSNYTGAL